MDVVQEKDKPVTKVHATCLATSQHGIHNGCIFCCFMITTEQPVLPAQVMESFP
jgi:hypothetical protein